ncbi:MAG: M48 family metallopeptidase [Lachnospiraceae bacterium]|nr:M48 family metallopeptidase [Lachnospiraceae bacterium]
MKESIDIEDIHLDIVFSRKKGARLQIQVARGGRLFVQAPMSMKDKEIEKFIKQKEFWIYKQAKRYEDYEEEFLEQEHLRKLPLAKRKELAYDLVKAKTDTYCEKIGVSYEKIRITTAKSYWGCCTKSKGTIAYIWQVILLPEKMVDYIVVHELCHMIEANHSKAFWNKVEEHMPDYMARRRWLKENGWRYQ